MPLRAFINVALPITAPGVVTGTLFAFMTSFDEIVVVLFIGGPGRALDHDLAIVTLEQNLDSIGRMGFRTTPYPQQDPT